MTQDQEIRDVITVLKMCEPISVSGMDCTVKDFGKALAKAIEVLERYLSCSSMMPSKKEVGEKGLTMSDDQLNIEDAVKYFNGELREAQVTEIHAKPLVDLAQRYLSAKCPEKRLLKNKMPYLGYNDEVTGYNEAIEACTLALMNKCEGLEEKLFWHIDNMIMNIPEEKRIDCAGYISKGLSSAIQQYLTWSGR